MRMSKKVGAPRDRRIDRRKVAMTAMAALVLFATSTQAQLYFEIDPTQSWLGITGSGFIGTDTAGNFTTPLLATVPQNAGLINLAPIPNGSLNAPIRGDFFAVVSPGSSIQFLATGIQQIDTPNTGNYKPGEDGLGNPNLPPAAPATAPGSYGGKNPAIAALINGFGWQYDSPGSYADPINVLGPTALPIDVSGNFDATGIVLHQTAGIEDIVSGIASPAHIQLTGNNYPVNLSLTYASGNPTTPIVNFVHDTGNIDPLTFHLVLPVNFTFWSKVTSGGNLIGYQVSTLNGQIVGFTEGPEPSTMTLFAIGVVGLLNDARRARRRTKSNRTGGA